MLNTQTLPKTLTSNPEQLLNYCALEIAEIYKSSPREREIKAIERVLKQYCKLTTKEKNHA